MAKLKGACHSDSASGSFEKSMIFRTGKRGTVLTSYYKPGSARKFVISEAQILRRESYAFGMILWNFLPSIEKNYWNLLEKNGSVII